MKKLFPVLTALALLLTPLGAHAFNSNHYFYLAWGNYNLTYFYPSSELGYLSPRLSGLNAALRFQARSVGSMLLLPAGGYDLQLTAEYEIPFSASNTSWSARFGAGLATWLDIAYPAANSLQPELRASIAFHKYIFDAEFPLTVRFYGDGFSASLRIQGGGRPLERIGATLWIELTALSYYDFSYVQWKPGFFFGLTYYAGK